MFERKQILFPGDFPGDKPISGSVQPVVMCVKGTGHYW